MTSHHLAFDLGAESGRAIYAQFKSGILEIREMERFANEPVTVRGSLHWDILRLWQEIQGALKGFSHVKLDSIGVDGWGVDYALLGERGELIENPYHYRDSRTVGVMEKIFQRVPREEIYAITGIQFLPFNTLYQLYAANESAPNLVKMARHLVTIPDLLNYWLTGRIACEYTNATTTQFIDPKTRSWAVGLLAALNIPTGLLTPLMEPGSKVGALDYPGPLNGVPVMAPACHDTGSAVAAVTANAKSAFLSSGTWSLLGAEVQEPMLTPRARELNFTNEGGVCRTVRLLKNIAGLWLLQSCRSSWIASGNNISYDGLLTAAGNEQDAFRSLIDPDYPGFLRPDDMPSEIAAYCAKTGQPAPHGPAGYTRTILESLAFKYREVLESLEELTGNRVEEIRIMGGGSKNRLLNQFTANATERTVIAGPTEATALGNIAMQMLATGVVSSLREARAVIDRSFPVEQFDPIETDQWNRQYVRFKHYCEEVHA
jgi:rhamnulokinase